MTRVSLICFSSALQSSLTGHEGAGGMGRGGRSRAGREGQELYALQHSCLPLPRGPPGSLLLLPFLGAMLQSASARVSP
jgi:hypothetical protein